MSQAVGQLRERIILSTGIKGADGAGGFTFTPDFTSSTVWADINPMSAKRLLELGRDVSQTTYEVTIRKDANIVTNIGAYSMRWETKGNRRLKFLWFLDVDERDRFIKFAAVEYEES